MPNPPKIQRLIDAREMEAVEPDPERIASLWEKALASNADSRMGLSADNAVTLAYQAGLQACSALREAHGYRTKGATSGHHFRTFYAVSALGYPALENVGVRSESMRASRVRSTYGAGSLGGDDVRRIHEWLNELLPAVHVALVDTASSICPELPPP